MRGDPGNYAFLVDFQGVETDSRIRKALKAVKDQAKMFRFLGCYKKA